eukprot:469898-Hanusia_phi.AAC.1
MGNAYQERHVRFHPPAVHLPAVHPYPHSPLPASLLLCQQGLDATIVSLLARMMQRRPPEHVNQERVRSAVKQQDCGICMPCLHRHMQRRQPAGRGGGVHVYLRGGGMGLRERRRYMVAKALQQESHLLQVPLYLPPLLMRTCLLRLRRCMQGCPPAGEGGAG